MKTKFAFIELGINPNHNAKKLFFGESIFAELFNIYRDSQRKSILDFVKLKP